MNNYKWKYRLLIIQTISIDEPNYLRFVKNYENPTAIKDITARKLIKKTIISPKFKQKFQITIYSIDGRITNRLKYFNTLNDIFKIIDTMPDRKAELKKITKIIKV